MLGDWPGYMQRVVQWLEDEYALMQEAEKDVQVFPITWKTPTTWKGESPGVYTYRVALTFLVMGYRSLKDYSLSYEDKNRKGMYSIRDSSVGMTLIGLRCKQIRA